MVTLDGLLLTCPSLTTSRKVNVPALDGAVKVGFCAVLLDSVTGVPPVWVQVYVSGSPFGSELPDPSSCTEDPVDTVCAGPAFATGGWFELPVTVMVTLDGLLLTCPSLTTSRKVNVPALDGAVNVGFCAVLLDSVTGVPPVWVQVYVSGSPFGSELPDPSSCTEDPVDTVCAGPAFATGGWFELPVTVMVTLDGLLLTCPSLTTSRKVNVPALDGAVNVGFCAVLLDSVTGVPPVWVQVYVRGSPSGSELPDPSSCTEDPVDTVCAGPAFATGAWLPLQRAALPRPSSSRRCRWPTAARAIVGTRRSLRRSESRSHA